MEHLGVGRVVEDTRNRTRDGEAGVDFPTYAAYDSENEYHAISEDELVPAGRIESIPYVEEVKCLGTIDARTDFEKAVRRHTDQIAELLISKNLSYGNSALDPVRIFSKASRDEQLNVRIDDKLSRIARGEEFRGDNDELDLVGYLVLKMIARESE